ncbi:hypothetical protein G6O69_24610 [Pseudenhygromyxa sp. WMMC2535]|uniref:hypothetical protein n=1 Tax=Pseudenhygromyxa sp. WMMC2535 TaxID=2712867 RepID=UPI0015959231|nr:hypothetical protein [Pseudenhygromyxa sp. WMMC2535]NVB41046.1 hypothetical protein [Pseudenhygromyxa sp. WMMC2535]
MRTTRILSSLLLSCAMLVACGKSEDKPAEDAKKADEPAKAEAGKDAEAPAEEPVEEAPKAPAMVDMAIEPWGVTLKVPEGAKLGELEDGGGEVADTVNIDAEDACGVEIELYRHAKTDTIVEEMFKNTTGPSGNKDDQFPVKDKTDEGYTVKHSWVIPLGDTMWSVEVGKVVGDHFVMCGAGSFGVEEAAANCALEACKTLVPATAGE